MSHNEFTATLSRREGTEAIKEASLRIKSAFPKGINHLIVLFTPHYSPGQIIKTAHLTLNPKKLIGLEVPAIIFEDSLINKGVVACCINKNGIKSEEVFLHKNRSYDVESQFRPIILRLKQEGYFIFSFLSRQISPSSYLAGVRLAMGKSPWLWGGGFSNKSTPHNYQIVGEKVNETSLGLAMQGLTARSISLDGYLPLGEPFTITKVIAERNIIMEINNKPAANIYRHYLEEKFDIFIKNRLFALYPFGVKNENGRNLINVVDCLQDGSLVCTGEISSGSLANLMLLDSTEALKEKAVKIKEMTSEGSGIAFIINPMSRKTILKEKAHEEMSSLRKTIKKEWLMIGFLSDYCLYPDEESRRLTMDTGKLTITLLQ